jgi:ubiquinone/menaquinone biosynthesis C-methylase UbiE
LLSRALEAPVPGDASTGARTEPLASLRDVPREDELTTLLRSLIEINPGAAIVEVGCGAGELAAWFARAASDVSVIGVDASVAMLRRATERAHASGLRRLSFTFGNAYHVPLRDASADLVVCKNLLCALADVDRAVGELCRLAKPGGLVVAIEPASAHLFHDPDDPDFAKLSQRLNHAFYEGWRRRGVDQRVGLKVPGLFLRHGLEQIRAEVVSRVHLLSDAFRPYDDLREQLETESYRLPESTVSLVLDGGMSRRELEEHNRSTRERLRRFHDEPATAARSGYTRLNPSVIVTIGKRSLPA